MGQKRRTRKVGPTRGLGVRYGVTVRKRYIEAVTGIKTAQTCPECGFKTIQKESVGLWACKKCGFKFAGGAHVPATKLGATAKRSVVRSA